MSDKKKDLLLVTYDPFGIPAKVRCESGITNKTRADRLFMDYVQRERDTVLASGTFPDLRVCRYDLSMEGPGPDILHDPSRLQEFIREECPSLSYDFSLRRFDALQYVLQNVEDTGNLQIIKNYMEPDMELRADIREELERCMEYNAEAYNGTANQLQMVETAQGTLLLPYTNYPNRLQSFLQYVADHYFTPTARQLGYVRMAYAEAPGQEVQDAASRAGYMFAPDNGRFLPDKAQWHPTDRLIQDKTIQGTYTLTPTYHDFHYFIEDHGLQVSPRNDRLFTLVFIAEYGCPQNFQRDPVYADHPDRRAFARLDRQLEEARQKAPGDSERFYRIQNRQQLLARDILRDRYGITIPEPKLTGTSIRQEPLQIKKRQEKRKILHIK